MKFPSNFVKFCQILEQFHKILDLRLRERLLQQRHLLHVGVLDLKTRGERVCGENTIFSSIFIEFSSKSLIFIEQDSDGAASRRRALYTAFSTRKSVSLCSQRVRPRSRVAVDLGLDLGLTPYRRPRSKPPNTKVSCT